MFKVLGIHYERELESFIKKNRPEKDETEGEFNKRAEQHVKNLRGKLIKEFDVLSVAEDFRDRCAGAGYINLRIGIEKLYRTDNPKRPVSRTIVDVSEMPRINTDEQAELRAKI